MFPQFKKINNESGIVLFIVLMTAIIIMIFSVGILTQSVNEVHYAQQQIDQIASDELAKGIFWNAYSNPAGVGAVNVGIGTVMQGRTYSFTLVPLIANTSGITNYSVVVNYDTFN